MNKGKSCQYKAIFKTNVMKFEIPESLFGKGAEYKRKFNFQSSIALTYMYQEQ